jgi:hypothetical protein
MKPIVVAPSILAADLRRLDEEVRHCGRLGRDCRRGGNIRFRRLRGRHRKNSK